MSQVDALAELLGVTGRTDARSLVRWAASYLAGMLAGLRTDVGRRTAGVPTLPLSAPFDSTTRLWVDGLLAGLFSRTEAPPRCRRSHRSPQRPTTEGPRGRSRPRAAPIVVLWASQTGNAEELAAEVAARLGEAALPVALHSMDDFAGGRLGDNAESCW